MNVGHFYYLKDQYFIDFPDQYLMKNRERINGIFHDRPCFYAFQDRNTSLYWLIPFSSQVSKFRAIYQSKINKFNQCDTIVFGNVLGHEKAFLIQNMCPASRNYIKNEYLDSRANVAVRIDGVLERELLTKARRVLALHRRGIRLIFPDVLEIERQLLQNNNRRNS